MDTTERSPVRPLRVTELPSSAVPDVVQLDATAFGGDNPDDLLRDVLLPELEPYRLAGARDPDAADLLVACGAIMSKQLTFPGHLGSAAGSGVHAAAGITWVAVRPGWRRRGLLRSLMTHQLHGLHHSGAEPVAILTASEGALYGRYGFGMAIPRVEFRFVSKAAFRPGVRVDPVLDASGASAHSAAKAIYQRMSEQTPGHLVRTDANWGLRFSDHEQFRDGYSIKHFGVHQDGFVGYRLKADWDEHGANATVRVREFCATTPVAFASLWRFVLDFDLGRRVTYDLGWADDPVQDLLLDPRSLVRTVADHVWLRIVDLDRTVGLRGYGAPTRLDVEITDDLCPWNAGTWTFELDADGGRVTRSPARPEISLDIADLAACFLGGTPLARLVTAGRVAGDPDALVSLGAALATPLAPWCAEGF